MSYIMVGTPDGNNNPNYATVTSNNSVEVQAIAANNPKLGLSLNIYPSGKVNGVTNSVSAAELVTEIEKHLKIYRQKIVFNFISSIHRFRSVPSIK